MDHNHHEGRVRLDVEDEDERLRQIQTTLVRLNAATSSASTSSLPNFSFLNTDVAWSRPYHVPTPTELLSRVTAFLPAMQASNTLLEQQASRDPGSVNIEHVNEGMAQYIEMNLGLSVFESRTKGTTMSTSPTHSSPASTFSSTSSYSTSTSTSTSDSDASYDSDSDAEIITSFSPVRPIKPLPLRSWASRQHARPEIVVLDPSLSCGEAVGGGEDHDHGIGMGG